MLHRGLWLLVVQRKNLTLGIDLERSVRMISTLVDILHVAERRQCLAIDPALVLVVDAISNRAAAEDEDCVPGLAAANSVDLSDFHQTPANFPRDPAEPDLVLEALADVERYARRRRHCG